MPTVTSYTPTLNLRDQCVLLCTTHNAAIKRVQIKFWHTASDITNTLMPKLPGFNLSLLFTNEISTFTNDRNTLVIFYTVTAHEFQYISQFSVGYHKHSIKITRI